MQQYERRAGPLALEAARAALDDAQFDAERITHLITVTCTGFSAPGFDLAWVDELPLRRTVQRTQVGFMGCHGALNALRVARAICHADPEAAVLLCAAELCSLHFQYSSHPQAIVSNALFGDGAAAAVISSAPGTATASTDGWRLAASGSLVVPNTSDFMSWRIGDHGYEMRLSPRVPEAITQRLGPWLDSWLSEHGLKRSDVGSWAIHPGGPRILQACGAALALSPAALEPSTTVLSTLGNMSSPTVLFILRELRRRAAQLPAVMLAFGPGLTIEAALVT
jgi:predicted naringenin-chalcone synthase